MKTLGDQLQRITPVQTRYFYATHTLLSRVSQPAGTQVVATISGRRVTEPQVVETKGLGSEPDVGGVGSGTWRRKVIPLLDKVSANARRRMLFRFVQNASPLPCPRSALALDENEMVARRAHNQVVRFR